MRKGVEAGERQYGHDAVRPWLQEQVWFLYQQFRRTPTYNPGGQGRKMIAPLGKRLANTEIWNFAVEIVDHGANFGNPRFKVRVT